MTSTLHLCSLRSTPVNVPLAHPVRTASGDITHAPLLLLDLLSEEGVEGRAYLFTYTPLALQPVKQLLDNLAAQLQGAALVPHDVERQLDARFRLLGNTGLVTMALAGVDMAIWDALARAAGLPLARLLGGSCRPVPAYFSQGLDPLDKSIELAHECLARGFRGMKIKAGRATLEDDRAVIRAVQQVLGERATLAIDFNQSLDVPEALRRCRAVDDLGLAWIEEPTRHDDDAGHARIAAATHTPIMIGENWFGTDAMARSLAAGAADLVMPDLMKIGGVSGWLRAAALARAARVPMASHLFQEMSVHLMAATPTALTLEILGLADPVLRQPLQVRDGVATPSEQPGCGIEWDAEAVARYRVG